MIGKKLSYLAFAFLGVVLIVAIILRLSERYAESNIVFASTIAIFLIFSWIQRKIKEDMLPFVTEEYKSREWRYYFSSLTAFFLLIFTTLLNIFIVFFGMDIPRVTINVLLGIVLLLMMYTVFSIPVVEETAIYPVFLVFSLIFALIVIASQLDVGYHLPENVSPIILNMSDPLFLMNVAIISWMASLMAGGEMPSPLDAIIEMRRRRRVKEEVYMRRNIIYAVIVALITIFILANVISIVGLPEEVRLSKLPWEYAVIFASIGLIVTIMIYVIFLSPEKATKYDKEAMQKILVLSLSLAMSAIFAVVAVLLQLGIITSIGFIKLSPKNAIDFAIFAILSAIGPFGFYEYARYRRLNLIEERFPEFLRDLAESRKAGMTMAKAVETAAKGDYGMLTPEIKKMAVQISWGLPFSEALKRFGERIKTPLIQRTTTMVVKASEAGGKIADVIEAASKNVREIKILQAERKTEMKMYLMIIYIAFFVFLAVMVVLSGMFLPKLIEASQRSAGLPGFGGVSASVEEYKFIYICTALSQAIGNGIVAGALAEGKALAGLRHGTIMVLITYIVFKLIL